MQQRYDSAAWKRLGAQVKKDRLRARPRLRQTDLAGKAGLSTKTISTLETGGSIGDAALEDIAEALGWPPERAEQILNEGASYPDRAHAIPDLPDDELVRLALAAVERIQVEIDTFRQKLDKLAGRG